MCRERRVLRIPRHQPTGKGTHSDEIARYMQFAQKVAIAIKKAFPCVKVGMAVLGLEVAHAHIHLVPMQSEKDMNFANPKLKLTEEEFKEISEKIYNEFRNL